MRDRHHLSAADPAPEGGTPAGLDDAPDLATPLATPWTPATGRTSRFLGTALPVALLLAAAGLVAACEAPEPELPPDFDIEAVEEEVPPAPEVTHATIPLEEVNGSGVSGEAMAMHTEESVTVVIEVEGLPEEREYAAHVHEGSCAEGGPVAEPLNPVLGLADGTGSSTTILEPDALSPDEPHFIQVHGEGGTPIACGDVEGHGDEGP